ncbi:Hypothetical protein NTJ_03918 [Nesidiocoris tenuis]|uniref:Uncharacterized protein n=1 Tax=Nesidiocoris tenuis TaxID=355587 RepID=A0ABN7AJR0_9HEMI|nr:Hypothetical protein NTJ_03918 [Nesidiocoris tenuis]
MKKRKDKKVTIETDEQIYSTVSDVLDGLLVCVTERKSYKALNERGYTKEGKPRKRRKFEDAKDVRKKKKMGEVIDAHKVKPPCKLNCYLKCVNAIDEQRRKAINGGFWRLDLEGRRTFVMNSQRKTPKQQCTRSGGGSRRENSFQYFLTDEDGHAVRVCKTFYLGTLGYDISNDRILKTLRTSINAGDVMPPQDKRGRHPSMKKVDKTPIVDHITSFSPTISHYRRAHAPNRLYLPSDVTIKLMHDDFKESFPHLSDKVSYELYRQQVAKLNISFTKLGHEECFDCAAFKEHCSSDQGHSKTQLADGCEPCKEWSDHHERYKKTRIHYQTDVIKE